MHRAKRHNEALDLYEFFFNSFKIAPNIVSYNFVIDAYCDEGRIDAALDVFWKMKADAPIKPSPFTYGIITKGLINAGRIEDVRDILVKMLYMDHADLTVYDTLLSACLQLRDSDKANELKRWCPNYYNGVVSATYMQWFFLQGRDKEAMEAMVEAGLKVDYLMTWLRTVKLGSNFEKIRRKMNQRDSESNA